MTELFKKWTTQNDGATAIEFALISVPVVFLIIGIIELSLFFATSTLLHGAAESASRLIRTGQIQQAQGDPQTMFESALCDHAAIFISCAQIQYEAVQLDNFSDYDNYPVQYDDDGNLVSNGFSVGGVNDVVLVRAATRYNFATPLIGTILGEGGTMSRGILTTIILQTEPYDFEEEV